MLTATIVYAINVPIDSISMSCCKSKINAIMAAKKLDSNVAYTGVCVRLFTRLNTPNISPSVDMAYKIRGSGYIETSKQLQRANIAPIVTILRRNKTESNPEYFFGNRRKNQEKTRFRNTIQFVSIQFFRTRKGMEHLGSEKTNSVQ